MAIGRDRRTSARAQHAAARDELAALEDAISRLDNEQMREVLRRKMTGYSSAEIGDELGADRGERRPTVLARRPKAS